MMILQTLIFKSGLKQNNKIKGTDSSEIKDEIKLKE
jgi:hypothetical protein